LNEETGRDLIPLTTAEARRLFNLHTRFTRPVGYHQRWSSWQRRRPAAARKSHYARKLRNHQAHCGTSVTEFGLETGGVGEGVGGPPTRKPSGSKPSGDAVKIPLLHANNELLPLGGGV
jgi:hypothetical protein